MSGQNTSTHPAVSVIVPVYNVEKYLRQCLDSLAAQTLGDIEFILVNDGSTDSSGDICREYAAKHTKFRLIEQNNSGVSEARNRGIAEAKGEYIGFADADDWTEPGMYENLYNTAKDNNADMASCSYNIFFECKMKTIPGDISPVTKALEKTDGKFSGAEELLLDSGTVWNRLFKADTIKNNGIVFPQDISVGEDCLFYWTALCRSQRLSVTQYRGCNHRASRADSILTSGEKMPDALKCVKKLFDFLKSGKKESLIPWANHIALSFLSFAYAGTPERLKSVFFEDICGFFHENSIVSFEQVAMPPYSGKMMHRLRYFVLGILHPMTLKAILAEDKKRFDRIIAFREMLAKAPVLFAKRKIAIK